MLRLNSGIFDQCLLIFDCDGVLVDSERLAAQVFSDQLKLHNLVLTPAQCLFHFKGLTLEACLEKVTALSKISLPVNFLDDLKQATRVSFAQQLRPVVGAEAVLDCVQRLQIDRCVASNGGLAKVRHSLNVTGLDRFFADRIYSAEQVVQGKPAPDLFLWAAQQQGYAPEDCWVIEDSLLGVEAALAAKMKVIWLAEGEVNADVNMVQTHSPVVRINALAELQVALCQADKY